MLLASNQPGGGIVNTQQSSFEWDLVLMMVLLTGAIAAVIAALV